MSKGEIVEHLGEGRYRVKLKYAVDRVKAEIAELEERLAEIAVQLPEAKLAVTEKENEIKQVKSYLDEWIALYETDPDEAREGIIDNQKVLIRLQGDLRKIKFYAEKLKAERLSARKRRHLLESIPEEKELEAWCADYSDELSGLVGMVDINDEGRQGVVIQPGFEGAAEYLPARDGILMPRKAQSGAQVFFNAAILPGIQKWQPRYRLGTLASLRNDTGTVTLDDAESSEQGLDINRERTLNNVPIQYMDCNGTVFEEGDKVLVRWFSSGPQVVGFAREPRPCVLPGFFFAPASYSLDTNRTTLYGQPITEDNAPLGTAGGSDPGWILYQDPEKLPYGTLKGRSTANSGPANWQGNNGIHLSWDGHGNRARLSPNSGQKVYFRLRVAVDMSDHEPYQDDLVIGAGYDGVSLLVMTSNSYYSGARLTLHRWSVDSKMRLTGPRATVAEIQLEEWQKPESGCYWSADGQNAVMTIGNNPSYGQPPASMDRTAYLEYPRQVLWRLSVSSYGGHSLTQIYDDVDNYNESIISSEIGGEYNYDPILNPDPQEYDRWGSDSFADRKIPIYTDYIGNEQVTAYYLVPGGEGSAEAFADEQYGEWNVKTRSYLFQYNSAEQVVAGGQVLAKCAEAGFSEGYSYYRTESSVTSDGAVVEDRIIANGYRRGLSHFTEFGLDGLIAIDLRSKMVAFGERYDDLNLSWDYDLEGGFEYSNLYVGTNESTWDGDNEPLNEKWEVSVWQGGQKLGSFVDHPLEVRELYESNDWMSPTANVSTGTFGPMDAPGGLNAESFGFFGAGGLDGDYAVSLKYWRDFVSEWAHFAEVSRVGDPASGLFGQSAGDPFYLEGLTLI